MQPTPRRADTHWSALMRIAVVGTPGAGKTTAAKTMAAAPGLPHIELDSIHWEPGWQALTKADPDEFTRRVSAAVAPDAWVVDGNYGAVRRLVWRRATHLIWLDYDRPVIMYRVIKARSFAPPRRQNCGPETRKTGATGCGRAIRSCGHGRPGVNAVRITRNSLPAKNAGTCGCCGCGGHAKQRAWSMR
jgi:hypothetical protein